MFDELMKLCDRRCELRQAIEAAGDIRWRNDELANEIRRRKRELNQVNANIRQLRKKVQLALPLPYPADQGDKTQ